MSTTAELTIRLSGFRTSFCYCKHDLQRIVIMYCFVLLLKARWPAESSRAVQDTDHLHSICCCCSRGIGSYLARDAVGHSCVLPSLVSEGDWLRVWCHWLVFDISSMVCLAGFAAVVTGTAWQRTQKTPIGINSAFYYESAHSVNIARRT